MVVRALPVVESAPVSGQAPLVRKEAAPVASGQCHDESESHEHSAECGQPIPESMIHDETPKVPVKSFRDDIKRKVALKKVMGKHEPPDKKDQGPVHATEEWSDAARAASAAARKKGWEGKYATQNGSVLHMEHPKFPGHEIQIGKNGGWAHNVGVGGGSNWGSGVRNFQRGEGPKDMDAHMQRFHGAKSVEATFANPPGPIPKPFKKNSKDEVVNDYAPTRRYKTTEGGPGSGRRPEGVPGRHHKVLSQAGYTPTGKTSSGEQIYEHPNGSRAEVGIAGDVAHFAPGSKEPTFGLKSIPTRQTEAVPSSFNDDPAGMDDTSDLDLGMLDPDNNEEIPSGDDQLWTKEEVNYRYSGDKFESCGNCVHFKFPGACDIIAGPIRPVDVCDKFEAADEDKGNPFGYGWENPPEESEDAHSVNDQTVPSTLVPLKDEQVVQAQLVAAPKTGGYGGFGKSDGMKTTDTRGGDAFGKRGMKNDDVVKSKRPSFGPASTWGMVTRDKEGGPGSGRTPGSGTPPGVRVDGQMHDVHGNAHTLFTDKITGSTMMLPEHKATPGNMHAKAVAKRREFYGDPTERRQAMKKSFGASESAAIKALANRLAESAFDKLKGKLAHKKGVTSPGGLAAYIGRQKYGAAGMAKKAAAGRRKTTEAPGEFMKFGPQKDAGDASGKMTYEPTQRNKKFKGLRDTGKKIAPEA